MKTFYHVTSISNITSIIENGIRLNAKGEIHLYTSSTFGQITKDLLEWHRKMGLAIVKVDLPNETPIFYGADVQEKYIKEEIKPNQLKIL